MVAKFKALNNVGLLARMALLGFTYAEQSAACHRLDAIKAHIEVLEKRQKTGNLSIIDPDQWSSSEVREKLFHKNKGNNLIIATTYLHQACMHGLLTMKR